MERALFVTEQTLESVHIQSPYAVDMIHPVAYVVKLY